mmetsp:Transcript_10212/g.20550  ORF Transcript_10212/g.20550 Transcript_10212/m.20550 type:complete len:156 (+) Transcript_10212:256-723(+)
MFLLCGTPREDLAGTGTHHRRQVGLGRGGRHDLIQAASSGKTVRESDAALWRKRGWHRRFHMRMAIDTTTVTLLPAARTLHRVSLTAGGFGRRARKLRRKVLVTTTRGISEDVFGPVGCEVFVFVSMATDIYLPSLRHRSGGATAWIHQILCALS